MTHNPSTLDYAISQEFEKLYRQYKELLEKSDIEGLTLLYQSLKSIGFGVAE